MKPTSSESVSSAAVPPLPVAVLQSVRATALAAVRAALPLNGVKEVATSNIWPRADGECIVRFVADVHDNHLSLTATVTGFNESGVRVLVYSQNSTTEAEALQSAIDASNVVIYLMHQSGKSVRLLNALRLMDDTWGRCVSMHKDYPAHTFFDAKAPLLASLRDAANKTVAFFGAPLAPAPASAPASAPAQSPTPSAPKPKQKRVQRNPRKNAAQSVSRNCSHCGKTYAVLKRYADKGGHTTCSKKCSYEQRTAKASLTRAAKKAAASGYPYESPGALAPVAPVSSNGLLASMPARVNTDKPMFEWPR